jgi:plastocyanin
MTGGIAVVLGLAALMPAPAAAASHRIVAFIGAVSSNYQTTSLTISKGDTVSFQNLDLVAPHDVTSSTLKKKRPIFQSNVISFGATTPVTGINKVKRKKSYGYFCSIHPYMKGTIRVR